MSRKYYEAYDDRYRQVHAAGLQWSSDEPTPIVAETLQKYEISPHGKLLELGCGEGRDAFFLLRRGYDLLASDISAEAVAYCRGRAPEFSEHFAVLDCASGQLDSRFDFIYAVAVLHMLVEDADRAAFYRFLRTHLAPDGLALVCTMGDGTLERSSDVRTAFDLLPRVHQASGAAMEIAGTSCRMVSFPTFAQELSQAGLHTVESGLTAAVPHFNSLMYAVLRRA